MIKTPILFLVFNRLDTTKKVFKAIRQVKPPRLYVAADGPRLAIEGESEKAKEVRDYVLNNIDWQCEVKTLFRGKNLGCGKAVSEAITWFFDNEEMGIILEDDCVPNQSFFAFCQELLERYKDDMKVWHIGGCNFQNDIKRGDAEYYFSKYNHVWGWAGWANKWKYYDFDLNHVANNNFLKDVFENKKAFEYWSIIFNKMKNKEIDTWDYQWSFMMWKMKGLAVLPSINMISNIGFNDDATHTKGVSLFANLKSFDLVIKKHPRSVEVNREADEYTFKNHFLIKPLYKRILSKIKKIVQDKWVL